MRANQKGSSPAVVLAAGLTLSLIFSWVLLLSPSSRAGAQTPTNYAPCSAATTLAGSPWSWSSNWSCTSSIAVTTTTGRTSTFSFTVAAGHTSRITPEFHRNSDGSNRTRITLDGVEQTQISLNFASYQSFSPWTSTALAPGAHTLVITHDPTTASTTRIAGMTVTATPDPTTTTTTTTEPTTTTTTEATTTTSSTSPPTSSTASVCGTTDLPCVVELDESDPTLLAAAAVGGFFLAAFGMSSLLRGRQ